MWPTANVGIVGGDGLFILDVDPRNDGDASLQELEEAHGGVVTLTCRTGGGGLHMYFAGDAPSMKPFRPGIDLQSADALVIAPPSLHTSGRRYEWVDPGEEPRVPPPWLVELLANGRHETATATATATAPGQGLPEDIDDLLATLPADCSYKDWVDVGMALHHADPVAGYQVWDTWSAAVPEGRYPGPEATWEKWGSFGREGGALVTMGTVRLMARERGYVRRSRVGGRAPSPPPPPPPDTRAPSATPTAARAARPSLDLSRLAGDGLSDTHNASIFHALHGERLRYVPRWGRWLVWIEETGRWTVDHGEALVTELGKDVGHALQREALKRLATATTKEQAGPAQKLFNHALQTLDAHGIRGLVSLTRGMLGIPLDHESLDANPWLLGVDNGTLELETGTLRPSRPEDLITRIAPVTWDAGATAPRWEQAMGEWFPDPERRAYVQRLAGSALVGAQKDHLFTIHWGMGANGKGTFIRAMQRVLGPLAVEVHLSLLVEQKYTQHDTVRADLFRARLATASETSRRVKLAEASVKNLTGNDRIRARRMREDPWAFDPSHSLWLQTNHLPEITGRDTGIWRRIRLVKWEATFTGREADPDLDAKLAAEAPGILRWLVDGCLAWQRDGLNEPECVVRDTLQYQAAEDYLKRFAADTGLQFTTERGAFMEAGVLQELLREWCAETGLDHNPRDFSDWMADMGCTQKRVRLGEGDRTRQVRIWRGVHLAADAGDDADPDLF